MTSPENQVNTLTDYDQFAFYYDLFYSRDKQDFEFYRELARQAGSGARVLELACGSGRLMLPVLEEEVHLTGLDLSAAMLDKARQKLAKEPPEVQERVSLVQGDMCRLDETLDLTQSFDLIYLAYNSFQHLDTNEERLACLRSAYRFLKPGGRFVVDVLNPEGERPEANNGRLVYVGKVKVPERDSVIKLFFTSYADLAAKQCRFKYTCHESFADGTVDRTLIGINYGYIYRDELEALVQEAGFTVERVYGSFEFDEFSSDSERLIMACRRD